MSRGNRAIMDRFLQAVFSGNRLTLSALVHRDFELIQGRLLPTAGHWRGIDGLLRFVEVFQQDYDPWEIDVRGYYEAPSGAIVVDLVWNARLKRTGERIETSILEKWEFEDGKVRRIQPHHFDPLPLE